MAQIYRDTPNGRFYVDIEHEGLHKFRRVTGREVEAVKRVAEAQLAQWEGQWDRRLANEQARQEKAATKEESMANKERAAELSAKAADALDRLTRILRDRASTKPSFSWSSLRDSRALRPAPILEYGVLPPARPVKRSPRRPSPPSVPPRPEPTGDRFTPRYGLLDMPGTRRRKLEQSNALYQSAIEQWEMAKNKAGKQAAAEESAWLKADQSAERVFQKELAQWELDLGKYQADRSKFQAKEKKRVNASHERSIAEQAERNRQADQFRASYRHHEPGAVARFCELVHASLVPPHGFPFEVRIDFMAEPRTLIVDYRFPSPADLPRLKEVRYVTSRDELQEILLSDAAFNALYDDVLYQLTLKTLYDIFDADTAGALGAIVLNGWVHSLDPGTGKPIVACVLSVSAARDEFEAIDLDMVEPKACFRKLKGVGSSKLRSLAAVAPIIRLDRNDPRFIASQDLAGAIDEGTNIAAMDWEEFEHLVREIFEKEFCENGGEVKITRASRDRGVDAVAFDPDPIRGGKLVIQAKRYTNTVDVSAVRDLYGTVVNEGATKGILVSTSDYGPDAYEFAKGKPLTLLNGGNLLHLLAKHGHKARIDIAEAKRMLAEADHAA